MKIRIQMRYVWKHDAKREAGQQIIVTASFLAHAHLQYPPQPSRPQILLGAPRRAHAGEHPHACCVSATISYLRE